MQQKVQLPLRKKASAVHFFVAQLLPVAEITETYVRHVRNLRSLNGSFITHTANKL